jgi:polyphosphate:AMP phosphotransferase
MFEAIELGRSLSKEEFDTEEGIIRSRLLELQGEIREAGIPVIVIISGVEATGKGQVVNRLNTWLDARGIQTVAFWDETDEERERPRFWRFWRALPAKGDIGILFGSWYTQPLIDRVFNKLSAKKLDDELDRINELESMLTKDGYIIVKLWFHMTKKTQAKRLKKKGKVPKRLRSHLVGHEFSKHYDSFLAVSEGVIEVTDSGDAPWYLIEAEDKRYRDATVGKLLIEILEAGLKKRGQACVESVPSPTIADDVTVLDTVDLEKTMDEAEYKERLKDLQQELFRLSWDAYDQKRSSVALFEGWDAAGKGGAIRRLTAAIDARLYREISTAAPTDEEAAHHYLWRFWRHIPRAGYFTIYDRTWYGRVLVERVEGFASTDEWMRAYQEINSFEYQLHDAGNIITKFWVHISAEEQLRRFKEREQVPWKQYKITEEDWRNREKWDDYRHAVHELVTRTSTPYAPWTIVPGNDKKVSRITILETIRDRMKAAL